MRSARSRLMAQLVEGARDGRWLSADRLRAYALLAIAFYALVLLNMLRGPDAKSLAAGRPVAMDFSQVWAAGHAVLQGHPLAPYDLDAHIANMHVWFGAKAPLYVWVYPPFCLAAAAALAWLPYTLAWVAEQALMLTGYMASMRAILPHRLALLCGLAFPGVVVNLGYGQVGTLTAALAGAAAACLDRRPLLAGVAFAAMAYKPQLGLAIPVALLAGRCWATIAAAAASILVLVLASAAAYGWASWMAFFASLHTAGAIVFSKGAVDWYKLQSVFATVRMWGGPVPLAWALQACSCLAALGALAWAWSRQADRRLQAALLLVAGLLCTPYCFDYDLVVLGPAIALAAAFGLEHGFVPWEKTILALVWLAPLIASLTGHFTHVPLGLVAIVALTTLLLRRIAGQATAAPVPGLAPLPA